LEIKVIAGDIVTFTGDSVVVNLLEGVKTPGGATAAVDQVLGGAISRLIASNEIKGKLGETIVLHTLGKMPVERVIIVGLGKKEELTLDRVRIAAAASLHAARKAGGKEVGTIIHGSGAGGLELDAASQALVEGALLGLYQFKKYKTSGNGPENGGEISRLTLVAREPGAVPSVEAGATTGRIIAEAVNGARDAVNEPGNGLNPVTWAKQTAELAKRYGLEFYVLDPAQMKELGMGAFLAVNQGSETPARLMILRYWGAEEKSARPHLGLVGKGITFDSGGISIKPAEGMQNMHDDMGGGAAVIAAMQAIAQLKPQINVTGLVAATENLPDGRAFRPGDILTAMNGKTIEVISTDAEGRLVLADTLVYARKHMGVSHLVDVATLTGACVVALGHTRAGVFSNNPAWQEQVLAAANEVGEKLWPMPMDEEYKDLIKSDWADLKNSGGRWAGAISAAHFLAHFAEETPWVHVDIAGPAFIEKESGYNPKGATGIPARTLIQLAHRLAH